MFRGSEVSPGCCQPDFMSGCAEAHCGVTPRVSRTSVPCCWAAFISRSRPVNCHLPELGSISGQRVEVSHNRHAPMGMPGQGLLPATKCMPKYVGGIVWDGGVS